MYNVDFSDAELTYVAFGNGIDISNCIFPQDEERYLYIDNLREVSSRAIEIISDTWSEQDRKVALALIDGIYFSQSKRNQKSSFISIDPQKSNSIEVKLFLLFRELTRKL